MQESATGIRERRRQETSRALVALARTLTARSGLHGFTVEELCEQAGVSRRTFFNYFASKEDAVLGIPLHTDLSGAQELFVAAGGTTDAVSHTLIDDLVALATARLAAMDVSPETAAELSAAIDREPRLIARMIAHTTDMERADALLIAHREGWPSDDLRADTLAIVMGTLARASVMEYLDSGQAESFSDVFERRAAAARAVFAATPPAASPSPDTAPLQAAVPSPARTAPEGHP